MASRGVKASPFALALALCIAVLMSQTSIVDANKVSKAILNEIDKCWRWNRNWLNHREQLATCSVGYAGKMMNNIGHGVTHYVVTDPSDDPIHPRPGTLRYGAAVVQGKRWITFQSDMSIKLVKPLLVGSFTTIDGRGANVHISGGACLLLQRVTDVIIHGLRIHDCKAQGPGPVIGPNGKIVNMGNVDADAIRMVTASKIWIDHNTLYGCEDGLLDVTRGSTNITISSNWFRAQNKVMLLGHADGFIRDKDMKVTVAYNHFGPNCHQRMPRIRYGYAHVVNNLYKGWGLYAIGGSSNPSIKSQANLFIAPSSGKKEVTWRKHTGEGSSWNFRSVKDVFENGASFIEDGTGGAVVKPNYTPEQSFQVACALTVRSLTRNSGALKCKSRC